MSKRCYCVTLEDGSTREYPEGTRFLEIAKEFQGHYENDIVLVISDGKLLELYKTLEKDCFLRFLTTGDDIGLKTYRRSMSLMLVKAVYDTAGHDRIRKVRIHYAAGQGYYCTIDGDISLNEVFLRQVEETMHRIVEQDLPIEKRSIHTDEAVELFHQYGMYDKEELFKYRRSSRVNLYRMGAFEDYNYGYMVPSTGYLRYFALHLYDEGFVIQLPEIANPRVIPPFAVREKLFQVQKESMRWGDLQNIETVGDLNLRRLQSRLQSGAMSSLCWWLVHHLPVKRLSHIGCRFSLRSTGCVHIRLRWIITLSTGIKRQKMKGGTMISSAWRLSM